MAPTYPRGSRLPMSTRIALLAGCLGWLTQKAFKSRLLPHGPAVGIPMKNRPTYGHVDETNDSLRFKHGKLHMIYERLEEGKRALMKGPETVLFDNAGTLHFLSEDANLVSLTDFEIESDTKITAKTTLVANLGNGRPLGGKFAPDGTLYIADAVLGLTRIKNPRDPKSKLELVASTVMDAGEETRIKFADDVAIGPRTGMIYFTDATEIMLEQDPDLSWDTMYASKLDVIRGKRTGRVMRYDPISDEVTILARNLFFANGIAVDKDETFILYAESFSIRLVKYYLSGDKVGTTEDIVDGFPTPAYFDGVDCAWDKKGYCYAVNPSSVVLANKILNSLPHPIDTCIRTLLLILPKTFLPKPAPYAGVTVIDPVSNKYIELLQDPDGSDVSFPTGVTVHDNKLYLGSLNNDVIGVYDLS